MTKPTDQTLGRFDEMMTLRKNSGNQEVRMSFCAHRHVDVGELAGKT